MRLSIGAVLVGLISAGAVSATDAPASSPRPQARAEMPAVTPASAPMKPSEAVPVPPARSDAPSAVADDTDLDTATRPRPRNGIFSDVPVSADGLVQVGRQTTRIHFGAEFRPTPRPPHPLAGYTVSKAAMVVPLTPATPHPKVRPAGFGKLFRRRESYSAAGSVCGVNAIKGVAVPTIGRPSSGCGIEAPVRLTEVSGVGLSTPVTIDCTTAKALNKWVDTALKPTVGKRGGGASEITIAASYACRSRNNIPGGKLSEHARGHAVDISGFVLKDGTAVTVLNDWNSSWSKVMKSIHRAACGPFGTVLGPKANKYHLDHFHFDTARYRSGTYCR
ncbi:extensin family protein [Tropicimonas isoalkanivorans]|uniref:Extensin-like protein C-terminus n=1 Tax=Tropicimonas isoalkanivorans TaxID=441112 RepID=A0A1I1Q1K6_9RHOB|nr:extensin family protein [Tropicimonas isoalkanivorans]SFD13103.1 Extensin-like protein C-terminus [Tropicimonas isoalkanivorans]